MSTNNSPNFIEPTAPSSAVPDDDALSSEELDRVSGGLSIADPDFSKIIFGGGAGGAAGGSAPSGAGAYAGAPGDRSPLAHELTHTTQQHGGRRDP